MFHRKPGGGACLLPHLHGGDDHASVHDELTQSRRALVAVSAVDHQQPADVFELSDGEVRRQRRLLPFLGQTQTPEGGGAWDRLRTRGVAFRDRLYVYILQII